jgi:cell division septation protein DedD
MKKNFTMFAVLILAISVGSFAISFGARKMRELRASKHPRNTRATENLTSGLDKIQTKTPIFYQNIGSSTSAPNLQAAEARQSSRFTIEITNLSSQSDAEALLIKLKAKGIDGFYTPVRRGGDVIYRVRLGMFNNADDAEKVRTKFSQMTKISGSVARLQ